MFLIALSVIYIFIIIFIQTIERFIKQFYLLIPQSNRNRLSNIAIYDLSFTIITNVSSIIIICY